MIVEPAHKSDAHATIPLIERAEKLDLKPKEALADTPYGSDENCEKAKTMGVEIVSPVMGKLDEDAVPLTEFALNDKNEVVSCPGGCTPEKTRSKADHHTALFSKRSCRECAKQKSCPTMPGRKGRYLRYDDKALRLARRRLLEDTPEFRDRYRFRAGIEGTMSQLDRRTGFKNLRVRGLSRVSFAAYLKAAGVNILRAAAFLKQKNEADQPTVAAVLTFLCDVKDRLQLASAAMWRWRRPQWLNTGFAVLYAA